MRSKPGRTAAGVVAGAALLALLFACGSSQVPASAQSAPDADRIDSRLQAAVDAGVVRGVVAMVAAPDRILYEGAFGKQDAGADVDMAVDSIFRMMSMTKPVTSVAAMMLHEAGAFGLDDPIAAYLPEEAERGVIVNFNPENAAYETAEPDPPVSIRHLFAHTSGAGYDFSSPVLARLREVTGEDPGQFPLLYHPGTRWNYSVSTDRLGELVEALTGMTLDAFFAERIFQPLGMEDTFFSVPGGESSRVVTAHQREQDGTLTESPNPETLEFPVRGRSGLFSTAPDYIRFLQMLLRGGMGSGGRLLDRETVDLMRENHIGELTVVTQTGVDPALSQPFPINAGTDKFGLGFQIAVSNDDDSDLRAPGSYSWSGLYNTHFWVDPDREIAAVILMQLLPFYDPAVMALYEDFEVLVNQTLQ